jgi:lysophospholipase L1-like esterase
VDVSFKSLGLFVLLSCLTAGFADAAGGRVGVTDDPCRNVPLSLTAEQKATPNPYSAWIDPWLAVDWSQRCRYAPENRALPPPKGRRIVMLGDSITEGWKTLDPEFFGPEVLDRGISGQTTEQMLVRFRADVLALHPTVVHIMAGTNDIAGNRGPTSIRTIEDNVRSMVELAQAHHVSVVLASVPPTVRFPWAADLTPGPAVAELNAWLRDYAAARHAIFADYHALLADPSGAMRADYSEDGVHPNAAGYGAIRSAARDALDRAATGRR